MSSSSCGTSANYIHLADVKSRCRTVAIALAAELELVHVATILAFLSFSELSAEDKDGGVDKGHSAADLGLKMSLDIADRQPRGSFKVNEPEIIKHGLFRRGSTIDEDVSGRECQGNVTFPRGNGILLLDLLPIVVGLC